MRPPPHLFARQGHESRKASKYSQGSPDNGQLSGPVGPVSGEGRSRPVASRDLVAADGASDAQHFGQARLYQRLVHRAVEGIFKEVQP
jgi:hypothetical protein